MLIIHIYASSYVFRVLFHFHDKFTIQCFVMGNQFFMNQLLSRFPLYSCIKMVSWLLATVDIASAARQWLFGTQLGLNTRLLFDSIRNSAGTSRYRLAQFNIEMNFKKKLSYLTLKDIVSCNNWLRRFAPMLEDVWKLSTLNVGQWLYTIHRTWYLGERSVHQ